MASENKVWKNLVAEYLKKVEKALSSVKHPHTSEVLEDVQSHLEQRFAELSPDDQTRKNLKEIIIEMGDASEYAELLASDTIAASHKKDQPKRSIYLNIAGVAAAVAIVLAIVIFSINKPLPKTQWNCLSKLDFATLRSFSHYESFYEKNFHKNTGYDKASQKQKDAMIKQWTEEVRNFDYEKAVLATAAISETKAPETIKVLTEIATTKGGDNRIKWIAVRGLAKIADRTTIPVLISLIDHYNKNVRVYSKVALAEITGQFFGDSKEQWQQWWTKNQ